MRLTELNDLYEREDDSPESILSAAAAALEAVGVSVPVSPWDTAGAVWIAEAINWAAKAIDEDFYFLKPRVIEAARAIGCDGGWGEDGCFFLADPRAGVSSFHDPFGEIRADGTWSHPWSGIRRQDFAFSILTDTRVRRVFREATAPDGAILGVSDSRVRKILARLENPKEAAAPDGN